MKKPWNEQQKNGIKDGHEMEQRARSKATVKIYTVHFICIRFATLCVCERCKINQCSTLDYRPNSRKHIHIKCKKKEKNNNNKTNKTSVANESILLE